MRLRKVKGAKEAIDASSLVIHNAISQKGRWQEVFGNKNPIHIEIGMGKGRFLTALRACRGGSEEDISALIIRSEPMGGRRSLIHRIRYGEVRRDRMVCFSRSRPYFKADSTNEIQQDDAAGYDRLFV